MFVFDQVEMWAATASSPLLIFRCFSTWHRNTATKVTSVLHALNKIYRNWRVAVICCYFLIAVVLGTCFINACPIEELAGVHVPHRLLMLTLWGLSSSFTETISFSVQTSSTFHRMPDVRVHGLHQYVNIAERKQHASTRLRIKSATPAPYVSLPT